MMLSRTGPANPAVQKNLRELDLQEYAFCDFQGQIFMAAVDLDYEIPVFADAFMNSQLAGVVDHNFSVTNGMEQKSFTRLLNVPLLLKSPETIVSVTMWLEETAARMKEGESFMTTISRIHEEELAEKDSPNQEPVPGRHSEREYRDQRDQREYQEYRDQRDHREYQEYRDQRDREEHLESLALEYEYAYWLGYIYRCECILHEESSRMVYGIFPENFMKKTYEQMILTAGPYDIEQSAQEICQRLDLLFVQEFQKKRKP